MADVECQNRQGKTRKCGHAAPANRCNPRREHDKAQACRKIVIEEAPSEICVVGKEGAGKRCSVRPAKQGALDRRRP